MQRTTGLLEREAVGPGGIPTILSAAHALDTSHARGIEVLTISFREWLVRVVDDIVLFVASLWYRLWRPACACLSARLCGIAV